MFFFRMFWADKPKTEKHTHTETVKQKSQPQDTHIETSKQMSQPQDKP